MCACRGIWWILIVVDPEQKQTTETLYDPAISGEIMRPWDSFKRAEHGVEKVIARRAAMELRQGQTANLGFGISAMVPRILLEEGHAQSVTWAIEQGAVGGMPLTGFAFGCASNADAFMPSPNQFTYFQGGGFDMAFLSFMEVDVEGNVNVSKLGKKPYLTAGCGGFVDITAHAKKIVFSGWFEAGAEMALSDDALTVAKPGKFTKMVEAVEHVTFSGKRARETGQDVLYVTERCVIRLTDKGLFATEIMPGINAALDIAEASQGRVKVAENAKLMPTSLLKAGTDGTDAMSGVRFSVEDRIATSRSTIPSKLNALTPDMLVQLCGLCDQIEMDHEVVCVLLTAAGDRFFCAGADINAWSGYSPQEFSRYWVRSGHRVFDRLGAALQADHRGPFRQRIWRRAGIGCGVRHPRHGPECAGRAAGDGGGHCARLVRHAAAGAASAGAGGKGNGAVRTQAHGGAGAGAWLCGRGFGRPAQGCPRHCLKTGGHLACGDGSREIHDPCRRRRRRFRHDRGAGQRHDRRQR